VSKSKKLAARQVYLGIEAGGTRTVVAALDCAGPRGNGTSQLLETGPANLRLVTDEELIRHFKEIARATARPISVAIGMAGARTKSDRERIRQAAAIAWPGVPCYATNDLETALMAADRGRADITARVLVLSGTGSCCFGRREDGQTAKLGGWGHILGDKGSGYEIGLRALKAVVYYYDRDGVWSALGQRLLRALQLNEPNDLIAWVQSANKTEIAALAVEVFNAAARREKIAVDILKGAADSLTRDAAACAARLVKPGRRVQFIFAGSVLLKQPRFAAQVARELKKLWPNSVATPLKRESVWGAAELARVLVESKVQSPKSKVQGPKSDAGSEGPDKAVVTTEVAGAEANRSLLLSPTERRNARSMKLDKLPLRDAIELMLGEDEKIPTAIRREGKKIERAIGMIVRAFRGGGRLFYVGAGTSGRLGVLDASECPPTFCTAPEMVQGIIAGGQRALWEAVEGAEDDPEAGARAIGFREVSRRDVVVGIAASGRTPFVWGALKEAKQRGAATVLICFNPHLLVSKDRPDLIIAPDVGPEILTGSTRLKAGTATKLILNILTTLAMVGLGKVLGNLMIDVKASNTKLRDRATRIVQELTGADYAAAQAALLKAHWKIRPAVVRISARKR